MKTETIQLDKIRIDGGTQIRESLDQDVVKEYRLILDQLPPIDVFHDGSSYWLADGYHRHFAYQAEAKAGIPCIVHKGTQRDAILFAVAANCNHGLKRSNETKRRAVQTLLDDKEWSQRSDRWIADACKVSSPLVASLRPAKSKTSDSTVNSYSSRKGKDGKVREVKKTTSKKSETFPRLATSTDVVPDDDDFTKPVSKPDPTKPSKSEPAPVSEVVKDEVGQVLTEPKVIAMFKRASEIDDVMRTISKLKGLVINAERDKDRLFYQFNSTQWQADCGNLYRAAKFARPYAACPYCREQGCKVCKMQGWVGKIVYDNYTPEDLKAS